MTDSDPTIRNVFLDEQLQFRQFGNSVIDKEHLTVAAHLKVDGISNHL